MPRQPETGDLCHRVSYQTASTAQNTVGQETATWSTVGTYWAKVETLSGTEDVNAGRLRGNVVYRVTMRWQLGTVFSPEGQLLWTDLAGTTHTLQIGSILNVDGRNFWLVISCVEIVTP